MRIAPQILQKCWFLGGPTAVGKTATAIALARELDGEIIALDSMTLYRGMDIGTAKPTRKEQAEIPHHLLDLLDPWEEFSVAQYLEAAEERIHQILERGRTPLFVGGTGLYLRSLLRGVFEGPSASPELRAELEAVRQSEGAEGLYAQLQSVDPESARKLHPHDVRRVIRAIEVFRVTGSPLSAQQLEPPLPEHERPRHVYWLSPPRDWLYERINQRVDSMLEQGLVEEVQRLKELPQGLGKTAGQGLGYKEILEYLEGTQTYTQAVETLKTRTRQFSKRQHTWYRNLVECHEIPLTPNDSSGSICEKILRHS